MITLLSLILLLCLSSPATVAAAGPGQAGWKPAKGPLLSRWSHLVTPGSAHHEYPRPQLVRRAWRNLNGLWDYAVTTREAGRPDNFTKRILVPFPIESALSGVMRAVGPKERLWYRRAFVVPGEWMGKRILLHFGAVDFEAAIWVNGKRIGEHRGGYDPFSFDITDALAPKGPQEIVVAAWDPTDTGFQPRGKQVLKPRGIWYTSTTGIWRTVWIEPVPERSIAGLEMTPDIDEGRLDLVVRCRGDLAGCAVRAVALAEDKPVAEAEGAAGEPLSLSLGSPRLWSPDHPFLYGLKVSLLEKKDKEREIDLVESYFGMRKISVKKDSAGIPRLFLNNEPLFEFGPLDQGFWPDGLYTAPTDEAVKKEIALMKKLGFNMARKHVKIEPDRWYAWCDRLGLLVWQDMPSGDRYIGGSDPDLKRSKESALEFETELRRNIAALRNHPSIVMWIPFNEGWGQYDTERIVSLIKTLDPTRLVDDASGWADRGAGDVHDIHAYPGPAAPSPEPGRAAVLGEFGGLGLPVAGHTWLQEKSWGYRTFKNREDLTAAYVSLLENLRPLIASGLSAAVYTQITDVEIEVNGLLTYDRALIKVDEDKARAAAEALYLPPPRIETIVPSARDALLRGGEAPLWRYTFEKPAGDWTDPGFDDSRWKTGRAGFGRKGTPGALIGTRWTSSDIWIRRAFTLEEKDFEGLRLSIHHDEDAEVFLDGRLAARLEGYTTNYVMAPLSEAAAQAIGKGRKVIAVHCRQTAGGQYIDLGLVDLVDSSNSGNR